MNHMAFRALYGSDVIADHVRPHGQDKPPPPSMVSPADAYVRYTDRPMDWRTRLVGMGGTAAVFLALLGGALFTWRVAYAPAAQPAPLMVRMLTVAAPPEPVQEVPEGPPQVEQKEQTPERVMEEVPEIPEIIPHASPMVMVAPPPAPMPATNPAPETTAPRSIPAPPGNEAASDAEATWEALLLAHLEKYRRYPDAARQRRAQGVAWVKFRMNRQGRVLSAEITRSSGAAVLDRAALETVRRAQPLPAIPDDRPDELELSVPIEFFIRPGV